MVSVQLIGVTNKAVHDPTLVQMLIVVATQSIYEVCKINLESFSFNWRVVYYHHLCPSSVGFLVMCQGITSKPVFVIPNKRII